MGRTSLQPSQQITGFNITVCFVLVLLPSTQGRRQLAGYWLEYITVFNFDVYVCCCTSITTLCKSSNDNLIILAYYPRS
ncbi:hypothetical protein Y032_0045g1127 [Ancylostoma ceylanicum]|uniref:Uncharacterized protein n=1 Tax=Ancylostoma ceylanicum TaxID=53326 RepID=A0A016UE11_9BILA|nr:hypothetical protein Y032_0045g1127 [Ancylostoma ceylanicum]